MGLCLFRYFGFPDFRKNKLDKSTTGIRLTTARYYTPSGQSIQGKGIEPDIVIEQGYFESRELRRLSESDLKDSLDNEKNDEEIENKDKNRLKNDYQLARAIHLVQSMHLYKKMLVEK